MARKKIGEVVAEFLADFMAENGYELYNTEFVKEGRDWFLRVYVEFAEAQFDEEGNEKYISTDDCEKVSRFLSEKLDESDPIDKNYYLEVSSPGMDRPLVTPEHYSRYVGKAVEVRLYKGKDGTKNIQGELTSFTPIEGEDDYTVVVTDENSKEWVLQLSEIAKTRLAVIF